MAPRFNKEPINLINRIPSQKQIDEARPTTSPYGQLLLEAGALCLRKVRSFFAYVTRYEDAGAPRVRKPLALPDHTMERMTTQQEQARAHIVEESVQGTVNPLAAKVTILHQANAVQNVVQSEDVAELRNYLVGQQEDIARLTSHIQELTSLVASQQQVLVHLGKELEAGAFSTASNGSVASSTIKRSRIVNKKPTVRETPAPHQDSEGPSLNL